LSIATKKDLQLIRLIDGNLRPNYTGLARKLGVSHTAIVKRVGKLLNMDLVRFSPLINVEKFNFRLVFILMEVTSDEYIDKLITRFRGCPRIISMFKVLGEYNLAVLVYAEDESVLNAILGTCMLRTAEGIRRSVVIPITSVLIGKYLSVRIPTKKLAKTPCGLVCSECRKYLRNECVGCPSTTYYRGFFATI